MTGGAYSARTRVEDARVGAHRALDRVTKVTREVSGASVAVEDYAYNALGALSVHAGAAVDHQRPRLDGAGNADAAVPATFQGQAVGLDRGGRVTSLKANTFGWSTSGQLRSASGVRFGNDFFGRRVFAGSQFFLFDSSDRIAYLEHAQEVVPPGRVRASFVYDGIDHPLRIATSSLVNVAVGTPPPPPIWQQAPVLLAYYELDLVGNVRRLRAAGGQDLGGYRYSAFGRTLENTVLNEDATKQGYFDLTTQPLRWKGMWRYVTVPIWTPGDGHVVERCSARGSPAAYA